MTGSILPLKLTDVTYAAGGMNLVKNVDLEIGPGRVTAIIGPNGAGKSLLMRLMHGLLQPASGAIAWHGDAASESDHLVGRQAMVFQRPVMLRRSVAANVDYALRILGVSRAEREQRTQNVLDKTGLLRLASKPARVLSGGEQQRLALARVWARQPEVLFLDEPTANLDPSATYTVEQIIRAINDSGTRIVMTTHDLGQARRLAHDVIFMHRGRIYEHRETEAFFAGPENDLAQSFVNGELLWWKRGDGSPKRPPKHR